MVKLYFEDLTSGMRARLDAPHRSQPDVRAAIHARSAVRKIRHSSINCILADAVKMPFNRKQV
jgi:hypothetical protein